jgi:hypothetical protein
MGAQEIVDVGREPALVAELEAVPPAWQRLERIRQPLVVAMEVRRQLPEDRAELRRPDERLDPLVEPFDPAAEVGEPPQVREVAARLDREREARRRLLDPARDGLAPREPVEGRVDLDRVEERRVVLQPPGLR